MTDAVQKMIEQLEEPGLRVRTGLIVVPSSRLQRVRDLAARLNAAAEDVVEAVLKDIPDGASTANLSSSGIQDALDKISEKQSGHRRVFVENLDLLLSAVKETERNEVWWFILNSMPYRRRVTVVVMPQEAKEILPDIGTWEQQGRCVVLT